VIRSPAERVNGRLDPLHVSDLGTRSSFESHHQAPPYIGHAVLDASGDVVEFMGTVTDITCRKQAGQALRRSEKELREVIDTIRALVWIALPTAQMYPYRR
jgi:PAS domain-containing protein